MPIFSSFSCGDLELHYLENQGLIGLCLLPACLPASFIPEDAPPESMVQFKLSGTSFAGETSDSLRNSPCLKDLRFLSQTKEGDKVITRFQYGETLFLDHFAQLQDGYVRLWLSVRNAGKTGVTFDFLSSFSLSILFPSPSPRPEGEGQYFLERVTGSWHHEELSMERAGLEAAGSLRFGTNLTSSVAGYYPFAGIEDRPNGILWGAQLENTSSFLMEFSGKNGALSLSGGMPDLYSSGHSFSLAPGETFSTMPAVASCLKGNILDLFNRLQKSLQTPRRDASPIYHGDCTPENLSLAKRLLLKYFLLDAPTPESIAGIRKAGLLPGISWNIETTPANEKEEFLLTKNGIPIQVNGQNYRDLRNTGLRNTLLENLCSFLEKHSIFYVRFLVPLPFGGGCDGAGSPMENQYRYMEEVFAFYKEFKKRMPEVTLELAAAGIGRLSPKWLSLADVITPLSPLPAMAAAMAGLDRQMLAPSWKCGLAADLHFPGDLPAKLNGSLLGRLILKGDLSLLSPEERETLEKFLAFYYKVQPLLAEGTFELGHIIGDSVLAPTGWQVFYKKSPLKELIVFHIFSETGETLSFDVPCGMREKCHFAPERLWHLEEGKMRIPPGKAPATGAVLFEKEE